MCLHCLGKCEGIMFLIAGILLALLAFDFGFPWYNFTLFFAVMAILIGLHTFFCTWGDSCCNWHEGSERPKKK